MKKKHRQWHDRFYRAGGSYAELYEDAVDAITAENRCSFRFLVDLSLARLFAEHNHRFKALYEAQMLATPITFSSLEEDYGSRDSVTKSSTEKATAR